MPNKSGRQPIPTHQWRAAFFAICPHVRPPVRCVKYSSSDHFAKRQYACTQRFHAKIPEEPAIGGLRRKNYSNDAFPEVLRVTFLRAAAATPTRPPANAGIPCLPGRRPTRLRGFPARNDHLGNASARAGGSVLSSANYSLHGYHQRHGLCFVLNKRNGCSGSV